MRMLAVALLGLATVTAWGAGADGTAANKVVLVELFTSEGCSSCPPADALLRRLDGMKVADGTLVIGLSEHVTYWNRLGWRDPFSQDLFTDRQSAYGERFKLEGVYTPQMVVNGEREMVGSDEAAVLRAVSATGTMGVRLKIGESEGKTVRVSFSLDGAGKGAEVFAVVARDRASSDVVRGENSGRRLTHVAVAESLMRVGPVVAGEQSFVVPVPDGVKGRRVVVFVQDAGLGKVVGVGSVELGR